MSLASSRSRRSNAGANMSKLLDQEEALNEDDFYKTHYGGFEEIANDSDFDSANSSDSENVIDSDFDIDETADQPAPEDEEAVEKELKAEERESKTKRSVYKDPKAKGASSAAAKRRVLTKKRSSPAKKEQPTTTITATTATTSSSSASSSPTHFSSFGEPPAKKAHLTGPSTSKAALKSDHSDDGGGGGGSGFDYRDYSGTVSRSLRKSTQNHSAAIREMLDERQRESKKRKESAKKNVHELRPLTQKELLKEAQKTEIENTRWLENYKLIEIERVNKAKAAKAKKDVPVIRYHSYLETEEADEEEEEEEEADYEDAENEEEKRKQRKTRSVSRTVITFPSEESFRRHFPACKSKEQSQLEAVVVTGGSLTKITPTGKLHPAAVAGPSTSAAAATGEQLTTIKPDPLASKENTAAAEQANKMSNNPDGTKPSEKPSGPFSLLRTLKLPSKGDGGSRVTCVITGRPARYFDPLTQQPYADVSAFKLLRYYYGVYLRETFPEQKDRPEMVEFLRQNTDQARQMTVSGARTTTIKVLPKTVASAAAMVMGAGTSKVTIQAAPAGVSAAAHQGSSPAAAAALYQIQHPQTVIAPGSSNNSSGATTTTYQLTRATPQQVLQLQQLPGGSGGRPGGAGSGTTFTILNHPIAGVVGGGSGGGSNVSTAVTPLHLINTGGGAGGGGSVYLFSIPNSAAHRGNPILRPAQLVSTGQPGQFVALQAQPKK